MVWTREIPSIDPVTAAARLSRLPGLSFLDSAMPHESLGRLSVLAADPFARFRVRGGRATLDGRPLAGEPLEALRACLAPYRLDPVPGLPGFPGAAIGYVAYDFGAALERVARPARRAGLTDDVAFNFYDTLLVIDHASGACRLVATGFPETGQAARAARAAARLDAFAALIETPGDGPHQANSSNPAPHPEVRGEAEPRRRLPASLAIPGGLLRGRFAAPQDEEEGGRDEDGRAGRGPGCLVRGEGAAPSRAPLVWRSNFSRDSYEAAVETVRAYIRAGDIYQANIAQRFSAALPPGFDPFAFYERLRATNPATFGAYLAFEGLTIASSSPERFLKLADRHVETRPIKGTVKRVADPAEDAALAEALQASVKERAENIMIVDLLRNDLSRVCEPRSVRVPVLCGLESYAGVHHLVSVVTGTLREGLDALDLIAATFPGGSITGAPKLRAMDIISEIEGDARELYCGIVGALGFDGSMDSAIAIRTVFMSEHEAVLQAGGGVTLLSEPGPEYEETLVKAARVFAAFGAHSDEVVAGSSSECAAKQNLGEDA